MIKTQQEIHRLMRIFERRHAQLGSRDFETVPELLPADASFERDELQLWQIFAELGFDLRQFDIRGDLRGLAVFQFGPYPQRARAVRKRNRELHPRAPRRDISVVKLRKHVAVPLREIVDGPARQLAPYIERRCKPLGRNRTQPETVKLALVLETKIDMLHRQLVRASHFVEPRDRRFADHDLLLAQQPVRQPFAACAVVELDARDRDYTAFVTSDVEIGALDFDRVKTRLPVNQRPP